MCLCLCLPWCTAQIALMDRNGQVEVKVQDGCFIAACVTREVGIDEVITLTLSSQATLCSHSTACDTRNIIIDQVTLLWMALKR